VIEEVFLHHGTKSSTLTSSLNWMHTFSNFAEAGIGLTSIDVQPLRIEKALAQQAVRLNGLNGAQLTLPLYRRCLIRALRGLGDRRQTHSL
jgi:hypothetical protein